MTIAINEVKVGVHDHIANRGWKEVKILWDIIVDRLVRNHNVKTGNVFKKFFFWELINLKSRHVSEIEFFLQKSKRSSGQRFFSLLAFVLGLNKAHPKIILRILSPVILFNLPIYCRA
jgi:hypothetical protein